MLNEFYTTGLSSVSVSRTSKGDYTFDIKIYFSGKGRAPFAALNRIDEMRKDLEKRLGIAGCPVEGEEVAPGTVCPLSEKVAELLKKYEAAEAFTEKVEKGAELIEAEVAKIKGLRETEERKKRARRKPVPGEDDATKGAKNQGNAPKKPE